MHGGVGCIGNPQIYQLEHARKRTHQDELDETDHTLSIVETLQKGTEFGCSGVRLNDGIVWGWTTVLH